MAQRRLAFLLAKSKEITRRGWYIVNGLKRLAQAEDKRAQLEQERRFFAMHQKARDRRLAAARMIDEAVDVYGPVLGWYSVLQPNTDAHCRDNHGGNFRASRPPKGGYPSTVHLNCRCSPGAKWPNGRMLP